MNSIVLNSVELDKSLNDLLKDFQELGYKYVVKAQDKFLSGWGLAYNKKHLQLILCTTYEELEAIKNDLYKDKSMSYVNWYYIKDRKGVTQAARGKSWTLRNDWTRAFYRQEDKNKYMRIEG